jgi:hypothetical protein
MDGLRERAAASLVEMAPRISFCKRTLKSNLTEACCRTADVEDTRVCFDIE